MCDYNVYILARDIERLADMVDPFEYSNYINDVFNGNIEQSITALYNDIIAGKAAYIETWLIELIDDPGTDPRDRYRAKNRLDRFRAYNGGK